MYRIGIAGGFLLLLCVTPVSAESVFVDVRGHASIRGEVVHLRDVAEVVCADAAAAARLASTPVAVAGQAVDEGGLGREALVRALAPTAKLLSVDLVWGGASHVEIVQPDVAVDFWPAIDLAAATVLGRLPNKVGMDVVVVKEPEPLTFGRSGIHVEPDLLGLAVEGAYVTLPLRVYANDVEVGSSVATLAIQPRSTTARKSAVAAASRSAASLRAKTVDVEVSSAPIIRRKDRVRIRLRSGGVSIESEGVALADARVGQSVRVRRTSGEVFTARAVDDGVVEVGVN